MFANLLPVFTTAVLLTGLTPNSDDRDIVNLTTENTDAACEVTAEVTAEFAPIPTVTAQLYITAIGNGYYLVVIDGHSSAPNASVGVRVYGEDTWFDDFLFSIGTGYARTDFAGNFNLSQTVYRSTLNEDWEGQDEIYAVADVAGAGSRRTNTITRSF